MPVTQLHGRNPLRAPSALYHATARPVTQTSPPQTGKSAGFYRRGVRRPDLEQAYFSLYHAFDERVPRLRKLPDRKVAFVPDLYSERERKTSRVYNEGLRRFGSQGGLNIRMDGPARGMRIVWALADPSQREGWTSGRLERVQALLPHLHQFVRVRQALASAGALEPVYP